MRIGVDIDDTITETSDMIAFFLRKYYTNYTCYRDLPEPLFSDFVDVRVRKLYRYELLKKDAAFALHELKKLGHEIIFITARGDIGSFYKEYTEAYLKYHDIPYDKIIFKAVDKGLIAKEEGIDLFIDDKKSNCDSVASRGIEVIHFKGKGKSQYLAYDNWLDILKDIKSR